MALTESFKDAQFLSADAKAASEMIQLGIHREQQIPDNVIMEVYGSITEGKNIQLGFTNDSGGGYQANIESYADLIAMMDGSLLGVATEGAANDGV